MRPSNTSAVIEAHDVCKFYRTGTGVSFPAVDHVSLTVPRGSFAALVGPSGSGKTTLLSLLSGLDRASRGRIVFDGRELSQCSDVELARLRRRLGFVFQNHSLIPRLPVWDNVTYPLVPRGVRRAERFEIAREMLERLGLPQILDQRPERLSGGEQQRIAVARALAAKPDVVFADEPTSNLDRRAGQDLCLLLKSLHSEGTTFVVATHDPDLLALATLVFELDAGRLAATRRGELP
jgi:putative ABC transport system ATP-binding protein